MDALLAPVLTAHGGLDRWVGVKTLTARLSLGGPFWGAKGWPDVLTLETIELDARREHLVYTPFTAPDRSLVFDVDPERITIQSTGGHIVEQLSSIGLATCGKGGTRLAARLGMHTSRQTLLRRIMDLPDLPTGSILYLGIDDHRPEKLRVEEQEQRGRAPSDQPGSRSGL